jgi:carbamoyl-phosphate synthase large subunit
MQLDGADIVLGVEMQSTGEAACFGDLYSRKIRWNVI